MILRDQIQYGIIITQCIHLFSCLSDILHV